MHIKYVFKMCAELYYALKQHIAAGCIIADVAHVHVCGHTYNVHNEASSLASVHIGSIGQHARAGWTNRATANDAQFE